MIHDQYIAYFAERDELTGKIRKSPADPRTGHFPINPHDRKYWLSRAEAEERIPGLGEGYGLAYVLSEDDPYVFLDIDHCRNPDGSWSPLAKELANRVPNAYLEQSISGNGLHLIFSAKHVPPHVCKNAEHGLELYHTGRFIALTGAMAEGSAEEDYTEELSLLIEQYFKPTSDAVAAEWTTGPCPEWRGSPDNPVLLANARNNESFSALWNVDLDKLRARYPDPVRPYDASSADMALASHLAYWTGKDCERIEGLMRASKLKREKWDTHRTYLRDTILKACASCKEVYAPKPVIAEPSHVTRIIGLDARDGTPTTHPLSEIGNAMRLMDKHSQDLRYVPEIDAWLIWRKDGWQWDTTGGETRKMASGLFADIYREAEGQLGVDSEHFIKWARKSQGFAVVRNSLSFFQDLVPINLEHLDADDMLLGLPDGYVVDLRTGKEREVTRTDYITKRVMVRPGDSKKCKRWLDALDYYFRGDAAMIDWLQRYLGYCLTGDTTEQMFIFAYGVAQAGKSFILEDVIFPIMGDYARLIKMSVLTGREEQGDAPNPALASLVGARYVVSSEIKDSAKINEELVKSLCAGGQLQVRKLHQDVFDLKPKLKLAVFGNHKPMLTGDDGGIWRRVYMIPFERKIPEAQRVYGYHKIVLHEEAHHILAWMIEGCLKWQQRGLAKDLPLPMAEAKAEYRAEMDVIGQFLEDCTSEDAAYSIPHAFLYARYMRWAVDNGIRHPLTALRFGKKLRERGIRETVSPKAWLGLRVNA